MTNNIKTLDSQYIANTYSRYPVQIVDGEGSILTDENGKHYIDLGSGIGVNIFGQKDPAWIEDAASPFSAHLEPLLLRS